MPPPAPPLPRARSTLDLIVAGRGNLGRSLARAARAAGHRVLLLPARGGAERVADSLLKRPDAIVFLTVPDGAVAAFAAELAAVTRQSTQSPPKPAAFVHTSGALGLGVLDALPPPHSVGSFHPLRSFPEPQPPPAFRGIVIAVDASSEPLRRRLGTLARSLGGHPRPVDDARRAVYHAAAVLSSNYLVALLDEAVGLLEEIGWNRKDATRGLVTLAAGALANVAKRGPVAALTGPIRRGDAETVTRHLSALGAVGSRAERARRTELYRMLGQVALEVAKEAGLEPAAAERVSRALTRNVAATRRSQR